MAHSRDFIDILQGLLTPTIAIIAGGIAFAQWWTARNKLKLDLFDRRWAIYVATREMIGEMSTHGNSSREAQPKFLRGIRGARWLFDDSVAHYLEKELWPRVAKLEAANTMSDAPPSPERQSAITVKHEIMQWVTAQYDATDALFGEFLAMDRNIFHWLRSRWSRLMDRVSGAFTKLIRLKSEGAEKRRPL